jgi:hypothetical protein
MPTILIAQRDQTFAEQLGAALREGGYRVIVCPGPVPPAFACTRCDRGCCPRTEGADLMIFDPGLISIDADGGRRTRAVESALAHPGVAILLAWSPVSVPDLGTLRAIRAQVPWVHLAAREPAALLQQIHDLLIAAASPAEVIR